MCHAPRPWLHNLASSLRRQKGSLGKGLARFCSAVGTIASMVLQGVPVGSALVDHEVHSLGTGGSSSRDVQERASRTVQDAISQGQCPSAWPPGGRGAHGRGHCLGRRRAHVAFRSELPDARLRVQHGRKIWEARAQRRQARPTAGQACTRRTSRWLLRARRAVTRATWTATCGATCDARGHQQGRAGDTAVWWKQPEPPARPSD